MCFPQRAIGDTQILLERYLLLSNSSSSLYPEVSYPIRLVKCVPWHETQVFGHDGQQKLFRLAQSQQVDCYHSSPPPKTLVCNSDSYSDTRAIETFLALELSPYSSFSHAIRDSIRQAVVFQETITIEQLHCCHIDVGLETTFLASHSAHPGRCLRYKAKLHVVLPIFRKSTTVPMTKVHLCVSVSDRYPN